MFTVCFITVSLVFISAVWRKGDGVMFVWRLSSALQQAMRDRMSELRTSGNSGYRAGESSPGVAVSSLMHSLLGIQKHKAKLGERALDPFEFSRA